MPALLYHVARLISEKHLEKRCIPYIPYVAELKKKKIIQHDSRIMGVLSLFVSQTVAALREYILTLKSKVQVEELKHFEEKKES